MAIKRVDFVVHFKIRNTFLRKKSKLFKNEKDERSIHAGIWNEEIVI